MTFSSEKKQTCHFFSHCHGDPKKPLEIYMFIDPLSPDCWALEPVIKKLQIQYGRFFTLRHILSGRLETLNSASGKAPEKLRLQHTKKNCEGSLWGDNKFSSPYISSLAIKAAELQGRKAGLNFLRKLQEVLFIEEQNVTTQQVLLEIASSIGLETEEFISDILSASASKALQCDFNITSEMEVHEVPTIAFFNERVDDEGIKITGFYHYDLYKEILFEMLGDIPRPSETPPLIHFLQYFKFVSTSEIASVYNMTYEEADRELKKYLLARKVERIPVSKGTYWKFMQM
ncbi:DsbA family protein [Bacillus lacus]|uniref:ClpXP adapter protein SpxH n=1 Tax=Metabacillus lacus TaxID=1983721 RepID=A0A7X2M128_9BACI|nr:ClpXP adapter SpxH family protein [Metabacillus lacus]MRX73624.1 DsbA family protein [Metabacillus lacus]